MKELDFDLTIGHTLSFSVDFEHLSIMMPASPVYERLTGNIIRGGVIGADGVYHWLKNTFASVEEFTELMERFRV